MLETLRQFFERFRKSSLKLVIDPKAFKFETSLQTAHWVGPLDRG